MYRIIPYYTKPYRTVPYLILFSKLDAGCLASMAHLSRVVITMVYWDKSATEIGMVGSTCDGEEKRERRKRSCSASREVGGLPVYSVSNRLV